MPDWCCALPAGKGTLAVPSSAGNTSATGSPIPPSWLGDFVAHVATRHCIARACGFVTDLGRLLEDGHSTSPQALLERSRRPGRSMGSFARALEDFFTLHHLALPTDQAERLAAGGRQRRIEAVPEPLRQAVAAFNTSRMRAQDRARRAGTRPRSNHTLETALATLRDLGPLPGR
ncbi:hypothetical protein [Streptomyces sp. NBC_00829]|uniref:hypothetical protein n=1 Tax=Streptomyces sp. NBC_00829 TaxID=2903679 RepID=UPI002F90A0CF|nr:hypothetical protein OG293_40850 [Streptomyces sp. NBC_00829]